MKKPDDAKTTPLPETEETKSAKGTGCLVSALIALPLIIVFYVLGLGPAIWLYDAAEIFPDSLTAAFKKTIEIIYAPLIIFFDHFEKVLPG